MNTLINTAAAFALVSASAFAHGDETHAKNIEGAVLSQKNEAIVADFDILGAHVHRTDNFITFHMTTAGTAGQSIPEETGAFGGSNVWAYVWPTSLDPSAVGFEAGTGILALAATSHPDFDDTPLFDENSDGNTANDGAIWHSHWVVLTTTENCPAGALGVRNIAEGETPQMPATWPGVPIFLDSPGYTPVFDGPEIKINVALAGSNVDAIQGVSYDGVTSALLVNANLHSPLLCVTDVFDVASGDLSLPGQVQ